MPDLLDLVERHCPTIRRARSWRAAPRRRCAARRSTSFNSAQRPVASSRRASARAARPLGARRRRKLGDDLGQGPARRSAPCARRPDQRHGLGEIADEIVGPGEQLGIDALEHQLADLAGFTPRKASSPVSAASAQPRSGSARGGEILLHQPQLAVARRGEESASSSAAKRSTATPRPRSRRATARARDSP